MLEKEDSRTPRPPTVSPVRNDQGKAAKKNMEKEDKTTDVEMQAEAAEGVDKMDEDSPTEENEAADATTVAEEEEAQKERDQAVETEAMARRTRHLSASGGRGNREDSRGRGRRS